jgi:uncharacterized protein
MSAAPDSGDLRSFQAAFAARIRDPRGRPRPRGVPARRMRVYEDLLFNNLEGFLIACFPITRQLLGARDWRETVRRYFAGHRCASPLFRDIPAGFLAWIEPLAGTLFPDRPFLYEFMHYEWLELAVSVCPEASAPGRYDPKCDLLAGHPGLNPTARLARYRYPVHRIGPQFEPAGPDGQACCYLVYRDRHDTVRFILLNTVSARLLELIRDGSHSGFEALTQIARELDQDDPESLIETGRALLDTLREAGAVY